MLPVLRDQLLAHKASAKLAGLDDHVFTTAGRRQARQGQPRPAGDGPDRRAGGQAPRRRGEHPLPPGVTAHKLRHTFALMLIALGKDPAYVMAQLATRIRS